MVRRIKPLVWAVTACAAVAAQAVPRICCAGCDRPCFEGQIGSQELASGEFHGPPSGGCPLCAAAASQALRATAQTHEEFCGCQLSSRHEQLFAPAKANWFPHDDGGEPDGVACATPLAPQGIAVSREYLATSLAVPIRPARILFGVWRN